MSETTVLATAGFFATDDVKDCFRLACVELWNSQIRPALIHHSRLLVCRTCLGFTMAEDLASTHPAQDQLSVGELCIANHVINEFEFFISMWSEAVTLLPIHGKLLLPKMQPRHIVPAKQEQPKDESSAEWLKGRIYFLEEHIARMSNQVQQLEREKMNLHSENKTLLARYLHLTNTNEDIQERSHKLLKQLQGLLTPDFADNTDI